MAATIVSQNTGDVENTLAWLSNLLEAPPSKSAKPRPPAPDRNRAAMPNNARQAAATKRQASMTTDEWLKTLPKTGKQHGEHRSVMGATGVSILITDGDITIYQHVDERGVLDAMGIHRAPNPTKWFSAQTVEDFDAFCHYWMRVRAWARYAQPAPEPAMRVFAQVGGKESPCEFAGWDGAALRITRPGQSEPETIQPINLVPMLDGGELRIEGTMPEFYRRVPTPPPPPKSDGPKRTPAPIRPEVAELADAVLAVNLDAPHVKINGRFSLPGGYRGYRYKTDWKVENTRVKSKRPVVVGTVFTGVDSHAVLVRELDKIVPVKRATSAA